MKTVQRNRGFGHSSIQRPDNVFEESEQKQEVVQQQAECWEQQCGPWFFEKVASFDN